MNNLRTSHVRIALLLFVASLFAHSARAPICGVNPTASEYYPQYICDRSNTEGGCAPSRPISFWITSWWGAAYNCTITTWNFGDGTGGTSTAETPVMHTYAQAGIYDISAVISTSGSTSTSTSTRRIRVAVANGSINIQTLTLDEGVSGQIRMTRANVTEAIQVPWSLTTNGGASPSAITPTYGVVSFAAGQATAMATVHSIEDTTYVHAPATHTYAIVPGTVTGGFIATTAARLQIKDNDYPVVDFAQRVIPVAENGGTASIPVLRIGGDPDAPFTLVYDLEGSEAVLATTGTIAFAAGETSRSFNVTPIDNAARTGKMDVEARLRSPTHGARFPGNNSESHAVIQIVDDEGPPKPHISATNAAVAEGNDGKQVVSIALKSPVPFHGGVFYSITAPEAKPGVDFSPIGDGYAYLNTAGGTRGQISLEMIGDRDVESDEVILVSLSVGAFDPVTVDASATVTILNDDAGLGPNPLQIPRGRAASVLLNVGSAPAPLVIPLSTDRPDLVQIPATITIPAGQSRARFEATGLVSGGSFSTISAEFPAHFGGPKSIRAQVFEPMQLTFDPAVVNIVEGQEIPVQVSLTPDDATRTLALHVAHPATASAPSYITVDRGSGTFTVRGLKTGTTIITTVNPDGSDAESVLEVNVIPDESPALISVSPAIGPAVGGTSFIASGMRLAAGCTLSFGGVPVAKVTLADGTLTGVTPVHAAGTVDIALTCGSRHFVLTNGFTYVAAPPTLDSITPAFGSTAGGTLVHATGSNFQSGCWMFFAGTPSAAVDVDLTTSLTAVTPPRASAETVDAIVRCGSASSSPASFAYSSAAEPLASIISIDPIIGAPGDSVTVTGSRFRADDRFRFDDVNATILRTRPNEHVLRVPELPLGMTSILFTDVTGRTTTTGPVFLVLAASPPSVTSVDPANTIPGSEIALIGSGLRPAYSFAIGGDPAEIVSLKLDRAVVRLAHDVPPGMHPVHVLNAAGRIASIGPTVIVGSSALRIQDAAPECGTTEGGTDVTLTGADFAAGATVTFNGVAATNVELIAPDTLRATTPAGPTGPATLVVMNPNGDTATITTAFRYVSPFDPNGGCGGGRQRGVRK